MNYHGLYYKKNGLSDLDQIQKADMYFNADLKKSAEDDYSWNTTLAKTVNLPDAFWLVLHDPRDIQFDFMRAFQGFLVSEKLFQIFRKYASDIQYTKAYIVNSQRQETQKQYYYMKFTAEIDAIDLQQSVYDKEYDDISDEEEIIRYKKLVLHVPDAIDLFITRDDFGNWLHQVFVSDHVKEEMILENLDAGIDIIPLEDVADFHTKYYGL